jgi:predicted O-linked N-acetylglucosamine transferase (SPINDLY family)
MDCIVNTPQEYIDKAVRLATDVSYREEIQRKICANNHLIFEDMGMVKELETHLAAMVREVVSQGELLSRNEAG